MRVIITVCDISQCVNSQCSPHVAKLWFEAFSDSLSGVQFPCWLVGVILCFVQRER